MLEQLEHITVLSQMPTDATGDDDDDDDDGGDECSVSPTTSHNIQISEGLEVLICRGAIKTRSRN